VGNAVQEATSSQSWPFTHSGIVSVCLSPETSSLPFDILRDQAAWKPAA